MKLAQLSKNKIRISDFTTKDRINLLDLFVNNEKTLLKMFEVLFPDKKKVSKGHAQSNSMFISSPQNFNNTSVNTSIDATLDITSNTIQLPTAVMLPEIK